MANYKENYSQQETKFGWMSWWVKTSCTYFKLFVVAENKYVQFQSWLENSDDTVDLYILCSIYFKIPVPEMN